MTRPHLLTRGTRGGSQFGQFSQSLTGHGDAPDGQISGSLGVNGTSKNFTVPERAPTRAFSLLKVPTSAFTLKNILFRHPLSIVS